MNPLPRIAGRIAPLRRPALLAAAALAGWFLLVVTYAWQTGSFYISRDQWHFLPLVDHYLSGSFTWRELWDSHSEHVKPGYKLLFMLNARYLGLNMFVEIMAGLALLGVATLLLVRGMRRSTAPEQPMPWLAWLAAGLVMMSFNQWANYGYGLLALGGFGGTLLELALFMGFSQLLSQGYDLRRALLLGLLLMLAIFGFSGARGPAVIGACSLAALAAWMVDRPGRGRILRAGLPFLAAGAACIGVYLALLHMPAVHHVDRLEELRSLLADPLGVVGYVSGTVVESMLDLGKMAPWVGSRGGLWGFSLLGYAILGWSLWRYFRARLWQRSWAPLMLISYSALFILEVLVGRYGTDQEFMHGFAVPRYVFDSHLWLVGCAWILGLDWAAAADRKLVRRTAAVILSLLVLMELENFNCAHNQVRFEVAAQANALQSLRAVAAGQKSVDTLPRWVCPNGKLCMTGIAILERYHLDFARDDTATPSSPRRPAGGI